MINDPTKNLTYLLIVDPVGAADAWSFPATSLGHLREMFAQEKERLIREGIEAEIEAVQVMPDGSHAIVDCMMERTDPPSPNPRGRPVGSVKTDNHRLPHTITITNIAWELAKERGGGNASQYIEDLIQAD